MSSVGKLGGRAAMGEVEKGGDVRAGRAGASCLAAVWLRGAGSEGSPGARTRGFLDGEPEGRTAVVVVAAAAQLRAGEAWPCSQEVCRPCSRGLAVGDSRRRFGGERCPDSGTDLAWEGGGSQTMPANDNQTQEKRSTSGFGGLPFFFFFLGRFLRERLLAAAGGKL